MPLNPDSDAPSGLFLHGPEGWSDRWGADSAEDAEGAEPAGEEGGEVVGEGKEQTDDMGELQVQHVRETPSSDDQEQLPAKDV